MKTKEIQKNPLMSAWKSHWTGFKKASPHRHKSINKGLVDHVRRYHMVQLAIISHKLLSTPWVNQIPIFMELKG